MTLGGTGNRVTTIQRRSLGLEMGRASSTLRRLVIQSRLASQVSLQTISPQGPCSLSVSHSHAPGDRPSPYLYVRGNWGQRGITHPGYVFKFRGLRLWIQTYWIKAPLCRGRAACSQARGRLSVRGMGIILCVCVCVRLMPWGGGHELICGELASAEMFNCLFVVIINLLHFLRWWFLGTSASCFWGGFCSELIELGSETGLGQHRKLKGLRWCSVCPVTFESRSESSTFKGAIVLWPPCSWWVCPQHIRPEVGSLSNRLCQGD